MKRLKYVLELILALALLAGLGYTAVNGLGADKSGSLSSIDLGLDLAGGVSITYEVVGDENPSKEDMSDTRSHNRQCRSFLQACERAERQKIREGT